MLEGLAAWVLNTYVGEYVENLNTDQLSIALLQGAVELENLPLKKDALKSLDIPLEVKSGVIGKITLHIPLRRLRSEPWVISIEKLYLVAGPLKNLQYDEAVEKQVQQQLKKAMLETLERKWQVLRQTKQSDSGSWFSYGASMAANVLENIQLNVKDVHFRYEDERLNPACPFACGLTIKALSVQSTDNTWVPKFVSNDSADILHKLVDLQDLGVYCDTNICLLGDLLPSQLADELQREMFRTKDSQFKEHEYILRPVNAQAHVTRNTSALPLRSASTPRITVELTLDQMAFCLATSQYRSLLLWQREFSRHERRRRYRRFRPSCSIRNNASRWWQFAIQSHVSQIHDRNQKQTKSFLTDRVHQVVLYSRLYANHLMGEPLTALQKMDKAKIEEEWDYEELKVIRERIFFKLRRENKLSIEITRRGQTSEHGAQVSQQTAKQQQQQQQQSPDTDSGGGGLFRRWFPGWSGWYQPSPASEASQVAAESPVVPVVQEEEEASAMPRPVTSYEEESEIEQEILDVIHESSENSSFLRKDTVFARMSFALKTGSFKLVENCIGDMETSSCSLAEMQCATINMEFESRPRTSAMRFSATVGSLFLEDLSSKSSVFPYLICPQTKDPNSRSANPIVQLRAAEKGRLLTKEEMSDPNWQFFKLVYEKNPSNSSFKYKALVTTRPIDIVYTPALLHRMKEVFTVPSTSLYKSANALTSWQFEKLRKQTQDELKHTLDQLLEAENRKGRWFIDFDISAPKLIVPEHLNEANPPLVVMDLGNFRFKTIAAEDEAVETKTSHEETEEDFQTPMSTPPNEEGSQDMQTGADAGKKDAPSLNITDAAMMDKLYEKYKIELTEMQVLTGRLHDNWRHAYARGTSLMHILDRFSISLQLERRLIVTSDPQWPTATMWGTLPSLTFHLNERKIQALRTCADNLSSSSSSSSLMSSHNLSSSNFGMSIAPSSSDIPRETDITVETEDSGTPLDNKLFLLQFCINSLSLEIQSQGQALLELRVAGVQASVQKKPDTSSLALTVHSLLVVDALQSYGQDFELLVASHHNVQLDSLSGSIRGSEISSPVSPQSPSSPSSPRSPSPGVPASASSSGLQAIHDALASALHSVMPNWSAAQKPCVQDLTDESGGEPRSEALIFLEFEIIKTPSSPHGTTSTKDQANTTEMHILNLQFNSLDFIANQETLVEILGFLKRTFPSHEAVKSRGTYGGSSHSASQTMTMGKSEKESSSLFINANFKRLNVLLLRILEEDGEKVARKVATATMSCAKVQCTLDATWQVEGSLGGLHLLDVVPEGTRYQKVISIGQTQLPALNTTMLPLTPLSTSASFCPHADMFRTALDERAFSDVFPIKPSGRVACQFSITKHSNSSGAGFSTGNPESLNELEVVEASFDMASLWYVHCPKFLDELLDCVSEFKEYMSSVATSIKTAATEVAMGMVGGRADKDVVEGHSTTSLKREHSFGDITTTVLLDEDVIIDKSHAGGDGVAQITEDGVVKNSIMLTARMETPVLIIPRTPNSPQVLLAHLGEIVVDNTGSRDHMNLNENREDLKLSQFMSLHAADMCARDKIYISLTNMNLFSVDFDKNKKLGRSLSSSSFSGLTHELGVPILYDTAVDLTIHKRSLDAFFINSGLDNLDGPGLKPFTIGRPSSFSTFWPERDEYREVSSVLDISINISSPIKLGLSKEVYEQILQTMDNLTYDAEVLTDVNRVSKDVSEVSSTVTVQGEPISLASNGTKGSRDGSSSGETLHQDGTLLEVTRQHEKKASSMASSIPGLVHVEGEPSVSSFLAKRIQFQVPLFEVELRGDFGEGEQGLVNLQLYDFAVDFEKNDRATTHLKVRLKSLQMDDLLEPPESFHRQIMISRSPQLEQRHERHYEHKTFMSTSCPDSTIIVPVPQMPRSLPSSFHDLHAGSAHAKTTPGLSSGRQKETLRRPTSSRSDYPYTPPPTPHLQEMLHEPELHVEDLVHIDVILVDKKQPEFISKYNKTNRFINVKFSCLDTSINLQTWVVLLDFLGMGARVHDPTQASSADNQPTSAAQEEAKSATVIASGDLQEVINSEIKFHVESFTLILNKPEYELARATAANLSTQISLREGNMSLSGQLGSLSLLDQSPHGSRYTQRFVSVGKQVMQFKIFKYGLPDFTQVRDFDISVELKMSSIRYVHTNRFQSELVAFCQHFLQLQDVLGRMRAASAGQRINETATRGARIKLDIQADSPILLIPQSSQADEVLVTDLGRLRITNSFILDGNVGTLRHDELEMAKDQASAVRSKAQRPGTGTKQVHSMTESLFEQYYPPIKGDPMTASVYGNLEEDTRHDGLEIACSLINTDTDFTGEINTGSSVDPNGKIARTMHSFTNGHSPFQSKLGQTENKDATESESPSDGSNSPYKCLLDVMKVTLTDMDLFTARRVAKNDCHNRGASDMEFTSCIIQIEPGRLLHKKIQLNLHVERNLEGDLSHTAPDWRAAGQLSSVYCHLDLDQYSLVRGILAHNLGEKVEEFQRPVMSHLQDPSIQTVLSGKVWRSISLVMQLHNVTVELLTSHATTGQLPRSLARLDFIRSRLSYESFSDQSKDIDLVSHEIVVSDTRFKEEPVNSRPNVFTSILQPPVGSDTGSRGLQVEMHFRSAPDSTKFTVLLNNMRVMCIFDWLMSVQEFLMTEPVNPFVEEDVPQPERAPQQPSAIMNKASRTQSPLAVSRGIVTKRGPLVEEMKVPFELMLKVDNTQFVVVENCTTLDTNAVILKSTAVLLYKPQSQDKVLSCSLKPLEVFSCCLMAEEDTALSIIDPMKISIDLNANPIPEPCFTKSAAGMGLLAVPETQMRQLLLEISFNTMNIRVSYHDMMMFLAIINSLPAQALRAKSQTSASNHLPSSTIPSSKAIAVLDEATPVATAFATSEKGGSSMKETDVERLVEMGFSMEDSKLALRNCKQDLNLAALWLSTQGTHLGATSPENWVGGNVLTTKGLAGSSNQKMSETHPASQPKSDGGFLVTAIKLKADSICLCLIDDCGDADVPLAEISCNGIIIDQSIEPSIEGKASLQLVGEYYNRSFSGWEPFLEPWKCNAEWKQYHDAEKKLAVQVLAADVLNLNITRTLLELYGQTKGTWTHDYLTQYREDQKKQKRLGGTDILHRRSRFIPYKIRNDTGSPLWFMTATSTPSSLPKETQQSSVLSNDSCYIKGSGWERVAPGEAKPFHFHRREKLRHKKTHDMHINQLVVMVDGWQKLSPVSVDKMGIYFRHAEPNKTNTLPARIVLDVQQEGSARKLIVVRSALMLVNKLDSAVELKLENSIEKGRHQIINLPIDQPTPIPLTCVHRRLFARPADWQVHFCDEPIQWQHVTKPGEHSDGLRSCASLGGPDCYRFCVSVLRENYPEDPVSSTTSMPGHRVTLLSPVTIINLLPLELHFYLRGTEVSGNLKPGREAALHGVDLASSLELGIHLENFPTCRELVIPPNTVRYKVKIRLFDLKNRLLELIVRILKHQGGALRLMIAVPFWLVNKSGLPLVFKQEGANSESAGQFEEHEQARSVTPLLFSFADHEEPNFDGNIGCMDLCQMRVGKSVHGSSSSPQWCSRFSLEGGISFRQLHVVPRHSNRPDWVYNVGIQVTPGRGRYRDTNVVTFAPRFEIDNQSQWKLAIAQKHLTQKEGAGSVSEEYLSALPQCKLPFHWPRVDLDQLLCVRILDNPSCRWSGGFHIDRVDSFHINMRDVSGQCQLLKVEVVLQGPSYFVVFANADVMPPPFRLDNMTDLQVRYCQAGTSDDKLKAFLPTRSSTPYAWDEPTLQPLELQLQIPGGTSATYSLDRPGEGPQLHYENFIYLVASCTFDKNWSGPCRELVLDCVHGNNIVFKRKENGKRSQLWRMTSSGMLEHEGSVSPREPSKPQSSAPQGPVLDISDIAPQPGRSVPLMLKKPDERRKSTQTWRFTEDGMLCCHAGVMCVQAIDGVENLQDGAIAVLGPGPQGRCSQGSDVDTKLLSPVPPHMRISRHKLRAGSGCLSVRVTMDGPIRVLQITDIRDRPSLRYPWPSKLPYRRQQQKQCYGLCFSHERIVCRPVEEKELEDWEVYDEVTKGGKAVQSSSQKSKYRRLEISVSFHDGIGISLVNSVPEELVYITLWNIQMDVNSSSSGITFEGCVGGVQMDNQLFGALYPVMLYMTPSTRKDQADKTPFLTISAAKVPSAKWNAEIFKHFCLSTKRLTVHIEERLLWKLLQFAGFGKGSTDMHKMDDVYDMQRPVSAVTLIHSTRYYFGVLRLSTGRVTLSMATSSKLPSDLKVVKNSLSVPLVAFEEAKVDLDPYVRHHPFETSDFLLTDVIQHYTQELKSQAARILGSVDFLGNPLGLVNDVTEGISGLINDGNLSGLFKNVTHGLSNTTAKFASTVSDGLSTLSMDDSHNQTREEFRAVQAGRSSDHLVAGIKGFGYGLFGGVTSLVHQAYKGTRDEGFEGLFKGVGKGVLGTITKPVSGVLDLTTGVANALRDTSRGSSHKPPPHRRLPRCCRGPGDLLPVYSANQALAQQLFYDFNHQDYSEFLIVAEQLRSGPQKGDNLYALISSRQVIFVNQLKPDQDNIVLQILLSQLSQCQCVEKDKRYYVKLTMKSDYNGGANLKEPQVRCDRQQTAMKVTQEIKYAKNIYDENIQTLQEVEEVEDEDW
ncbi:vacuolar protein sorting-associated protein 13D-like isoform X4 [Pomacea canaliculata]|uniref:vacuolar protein sorting-associated protein 13D-like isoform X4 n=1 Tax=Pomacea canaliculata TaxID=400727 RepID=UPI000D73A002|nr:vacuolar protein sorting-associated protein 13D-like isoform X4 [Pomacea canaliculata]